MARWLKQQARRKEDDDDEIITFTTSDSEDKLRDKGIFYIVGEIEEISMMEIHRSILEKHLDPRWHDDIQLIINSGGGSAPDTWALIDLLDWVRMDIRTIGLGKCCSAGAMLLAAGTPGKRTAAKNLEIMLHAHSGCNDGTYDQMVARAKGDQQEFERDMRFWMSHSKYKTKEEVREHLIQPFDNFLTVDDALKHGIIDQIVGREKTPKKGKGGRGS